MIVHHTKGGKRRKMIFLSLATSISKANKKQVLCGLALAWLVVRNAETEVYFLLWWIYRLPSTLAPMAIINEMLQTS